MKDVILKANVSKDFVVSLHSRESCSPISQKLVVDIF